MSLFCKTKLIKVISLNGNNFSSWVILDLEYVAYKTKFIITISDEIFPSLTVSRKFKYDHGSTEHYNCDVCVHNQLVVIT